MGTPGPSDRPAPPTRCPRPPGDQRFPLRDHPRPAAPTSYVRTSGPRHRDRSRTALSARGTVGRAERRRGPMPSPGTPSPGATSPEPSEPLRVPASFARRTPGARTAVRAGYRCRNHAREPPPRVGRRLAVTATPPGDSGEQDRPLRAFVAQAPRTRGLPRPRTPATSARRTALPQRRKARPRGAGPPCPGGLLASASGRRALGPGFPGVGAGTGPRKPGPGVRASARARSGAFRCGPWLPGAGRSSVRRFRACGSSSRRGRRAVIRTSGRPGSWFRSGTRSRYPRLRSGLRCGASGFADAGSACAPPGAAPGKRCAGVCGGRGRPPWPRNGVRRRVRVSED